LVFLAVYRDGSRLMQTDTTGDSAARAETFECAICFEDIAAECRVSLPCQCSLTYCHKCWDRALAQSLAACLLARCPSCRMRLRVTFDPEKRVMSFARDDSGDLSWRTELYAQAKPLQIRLLQEFGSEEETASGPRCVCGDALLCVTYRSRVETFLRPRSHLTRLPDNFFICDICEKNIPSNSRNVWTCETGTQTVLHALSYDVCESCFREHVRGEPPVEAAADVSFESSSCSVDSLDEETLGSTENTEESVEENLNL